MKKTENIFGFVLLALSLVLGKRFLASDMLFFRLVIGLALGYTLTRAYTGFAGSVNRAFNTGSTRLMKALMFMFFITSVLTAAFLYKSGMAPGEMEFGLWINPISLGLIFGGMLFGFGMAFSSCCASGVLTDLITGLPRALVTLIFFSMGVYIGFPLAATDFATKSFVTSEVGAMTGRNGVFLPDLFKWDGLNGYLGAIILTGLLCGLVVVLSNYYESKRKKEGTYTSHFAENMQDNVANQKTNTDNYEVMAQSTYERVFVNAWSLKMGSVVIAIIFALLMGVTKTGWGASTPYGIWFGTALMDFGVSPESIANYTKMSAEAFQTPFFQHGVSVQNFGILIGTAIYLLTAGKFSTTFMSEMNLTFRQALLFALGGLTMGIGTRLSNGCNVGGLYTPIAHFSLSGWVFLVVMVIGGVIGNIFAKKWSE